MKSISVKSKIVRYGGIGQDTDQKMISQKKIVLMILSDISFLVISTLVALFLGREI